VGPPLSDAGPGGAAAGRAAKLAAKGKPFDMDELLRMEPDRGVTNVRKLNLKRWRQWFGIEQRCIVPVTTFAEPDPASQEPGGKVPNAWFGRDESKELMFFAGIHVPQWTSVQKIKDGLTTNDLCGFLTTNPNEIVKPEHFKAMPVLLLNEEETDVWMYAPREEGRHLARPTPDDAIMITSREPTVPASSRKKPIPFKRACCDSTDPLGRYDNQRRGSRARPRHSTEIYYGSCTTFPRWRAMPDMASSSVSITPPRRYRPLV
jgi:putative SOS response-associated peptidase YedK